MDRSALVHVIARAGGRSKVAAACRVRYQAVQKWEANGVPLDRCAAIESATGGQVRCEDLRPDVEWQRDAAGSVTGYLVKVSAPEPETARVA